MLRIKLLRNLLLLSLTIAVLFPSYEFLFVHPAYNQLLTKETESEAIRYARYMVRSLNLDNQLLTKERFTIEITRGLQLISLDDRLIKLRIFSPRGEIIFSTDEGELGSLNQKDYFWEIVAKGHSYSKVVQKDRKTAEGAVAQRDVVETYVPFMADGAFGGAIEVYSDITESISSVGKLTFHSLLILVVMSAGFLVAILLALRRAQVSFLQRDAAEEALRLANEELEQRVDDRTHELSAANEQLTAQIAERTQAQMALGKALEEIRSDRKKLDEILHSVPDGVVVTDGALQILHMNAAAESLLDFPLGRALGQSIEVLSHEVDFVNNVRSHLGSNHVTRSFDFELAREAGQNPRICQVRISQFVSDASAAPGVILLLCDVTREREVERMKSAFLGMAAHELNTPLTTIIGYTELLTAKETASKFDAKQQKDFLLLIHNKALALGGLIDDLLDISRIESGRPLNLNYDEFLLDALLGEVVASSQKDYPGYQFDMALPGEAAPFCADRSRLVQVMSHLFSNAVKYSPAGSRIQVTLTTSEGRYLISVKDHGIGMNEEQLAHIFDRFYRADSSDTAVQGVGLGMSLVRNIVLAHRGEIQIESQPGQGTRVLLTLPIAPPVDFPASRQPFSS